ncbi:hypothetical protein Q1695_007534 [Nippostrongylus brasiliensis]|nr:hypothetical protein Q1695_007534 [Nippostrongylus brasiliensis]
MSRPPSARPKTSTGRAASAARRAVPDHAIGNGSIASESRPPSRISVSRAGMPMPAPPSRSGIGSRAGTPQLMGTGIAARPVTGMARPPTAINPPHRPVTQQGLSGGRAVSRLGTGSTRQVHDKSYFMGLLRSKINQITTETAHLEDVYQKGLRDRMELEAYEQRAKSSAMEVKELQRKLFNYNLLIDRMHTNHEVGDLEIEAKRAKESADELEATVQEIFHERQVREREIEDLMAEIDEQKRLNQAMLTGMDPTLRDTYEQLKMDSEELAEQVEQAQQELARLDERKEQLELELVNSPTKKKAMELKQLLMELEAKEVALVAERDAKETPEQKKQKLIDEIKKNNEDIATIEKQIEKTNELINTAHEEIREFDSTADNKLAKNNEKYRDLLVKEREYDDFLNSFDEQKQKLLVEVDEHSESVVELLQKISANIEELSFTELNVTAIDTDGILHGKASAKELQDMFVRLQDQLIAMNEQEERFNTEIEGFQQKMAELAEERKKYENLDKLAEDVEQDIKEVERSRDELEQKLPALHERRNDLESRLRRINEELESNPEYAEIKSLQRELEMLEEQATRLQAEAEAIERETNYEPIKAEVRRLRALYNERLIASAAGR